jgi:hypothetical protein
MKKNMGSLDQIIRMILAVIIATLYFLNVISGTLAIVLLVFAVMLVVTSFISFCPLYVPLNVSTRDKEKS